MGSAQSSEALARLSLQIAIQLPENVDDARRVLALAASHVESRRGLTPARRRAIMLGWRLDLVEQLGIEEPAPARSRGRQVAIASLLGLAIWLPLAALLVWAIGGGALLSALVGGVSPGRPVRRRAGALPWRGRHGIS